MLRGAIQPVLAVACVGAAATGRRPDYCAGDSQRPTHRQDGAGDWQRYEDEDLDRTLQEDAMGLFASRPPDDTR